MIGVLAGIIGTIQATEALKLILGIGHPLTNRFLDFDARKTQFREIKVKRNPDCALCGAHPTITELFDDGDPFAGCGAAGSKDRQERILVRLPTLAGKQMIDLFGLRTP